MDLISPYFPLWTFVALLIGTPGPANLLMMASTSLHGFSRSLPFLFGIITGKLLLIIFIALGFHTVFATYPLLKTTFAFLSAAFLCLLALKGWNHSPASNQKKPPLGYIPGIFVHPLNPKAWVMLTLAYAQFSQTLSTPFETIFLIPISFLCGQFIFLGFWGTIGAIFTKQITSNLFLHRTLILITIGVVLWALFFGNSLPSFPIYTIPTVSSLSSSAISLMS